MYRMTAIVVGSQSTDRAATVSLYIFFVSFSSVTWLLHAHYHFVRNEKAGQKIVIISGHCVCVWVRGACVVSVFSPTEDQFIRTLLLFNVWPLLVFFVFILKCTRTPNGEIEKAQI